MGTVVKYLLVLFLSVCGLRAANLLPNSSFEAGQGRGWVVLGGSAESGRTASFPLLTNDAFHGGKSMVSGANYSRSMWLSTGTYTVSFYGKSSFNGSGPYYYGLVNNDTTNSAGTAIALGDVVPPYSNNIASTWTRYTAAPFVARSNAFYWFKSYTLQPHTFWIDAIQVETGITATAYAPMATVECGLSIPSAYNIFFDGDTPKFTLNFWNEGEAVSPRVRYQVINVWNSNVLSGDVTVALAAATNTSNTITLGGQKGWFRITSRLLDWNDSSDEVTMVNYPFASNIVANAETDWNGGHPNYSPYHTRRELLVGRRYARLLSPCYTSLRWTNIEPTRGNFVFNDACITNIGSSGLIPLGTLTPYDGTWAYWATNADGTADLMAWSNYCYTVVNRYKSYCTNWEVGPNEPLQTGPTTPINVRIATNYVIVLEHGIAGVINADPTAKIIGIAGASYSGEWALEVYTNLSASAKSYVHAVSTHQSPKEAAGVVVDPNPPHRAGGASHNVDGWYTNFLGIKPVWNSEQFGGGTPPGKGMNFRWPSAIHDLVSEYPVGEAQRNWKMHRQLVQVQALLTQTLRNMGYGLRKNFHYDSRTFGAPSFNSSQPYAADQFDVDRPEVVVMSIANQRFFYKGLGKVTNTAHVDLEMFCYTNVNGQCLVAGWCYDKTNRVLTLDNGDFAVFDCMGNQTQTNIASVVVRRIPQYFVSGSRTLNQLSNTFATASVAGTLDVLPPNVSIDIAPSGLWSGDTNAQLFSFTAFDDTWTQWPTNLFGAQVSLTYSWTNVMYQWKTNGGTYTAPSQSNHVWLSHIPAGNNTFYVKATDKDGNFGEASYEFSPSALTTNNLHVSGTANIGTITVVQ